MAFDSSAERPAWVKEDSGELAQRLPPLMLVNSSFDFVKGSGGRYIKTYSEFTLAGVRLEIRLHRVFDYFEASFEVFCAGCGDRARGSLSSTPACWNCGKIDAHGDEDLPLYFPEDHHPEAVVPGHGFSGAPFFTTWKHNAAVLATFEGILRSSGEDTLAAAFGGMHYQALCTRHMERVFDLLKQDFSTSRKFSSAWKRTEAVSRPGEIVGNAPVAAA